MEENLVMESEKSWKANQLQNYIEEQIPNHKIIPEAGTDTEKSHLSR